MSFSISLVQSGTASSARRPMFVPLSTTTISVAVNGTTPQLFPCSGSTCSGTLSAPAGGTVNFVFAALDTQQRVLSEGSLTLPIAVNGVNALNVTLAGIIDHATLAPSPPGLVSYQSGSSTVSATAYDADNDVITGTYFAPLVLSLSGDATGTLAVTAATLASSSATGSVTYTFASATQYAENHVLLSQTSATETTPSSVPFEVGRTFYTFTSANTIVGFAPGFTTPSRTVTLPALDSVADVACDGSNLYLDDAAAGAVYGLGPTATSPVTYTSQLAEPNWVAANGGIPPSTRAQMYVASNDGSQDILGFQGSTSAPPFPLPPDAVAQSGNITSGRGSLAVVSTGNVFASRGGPSYMGNGGWTVYSPTLAGINGGSNTNGTDDDIIAVDTSVSPMRIYVEGFNATTFAPEIDEYDNFATTPTFISSDSNDAGLFVDSTGRIFTSKFVVLPDGRLRAPGRGATASRRRTLAGTGDVYDVYAPGGLAGSVQYTIPGESLAFDSQNYVYALQDNGSINVYAPGSSNLVFTMPGTTYGSPSPYAFAFGTFCR